MNNFPAFGGSRGMFINYLVPPFIWFFSGEYEVGNFPDIEEDDSV